MKARKIAGYWFVGMCLIGSVAGNGHAEPANTRNVLFIIIDDLRNELGCYGADHVHTPNMDRLAARGVRFDRAYVQATFCNPSRSSFLTGLRPNATRILDNRTPYSKYLPDVVTLPRLFRQNGYYTAGFGKVFHARTPQDDQANWDFYGRGRTSELGRRGEGRNLTGGTVKWCSWRAAEGDDEDQADGQLARHAVQFLENPPIDRPFFLAVGFHKPHDPFVAPKQDFERYPLASLSIPRDPFDKSPSTIPITNWKESFDEFTDRERREFLRAYYACTTFVDRQVGRVLRALETSGLQKNTIVLLIGDHGYHLGEHGWWNKNTLYELSCRAPLIVSVPGNENSGSACAAIVEFVDLYPTLADLCDLEPPQNLHGRSLRSLLDDPRGPGRTAAFSWYGDGISVRTNRWRYTAWKDGLRELFDCTNDPFEYYNLAEHPDFAETITRLHQQLPVDTPRPN